jgi:hypothetical protein
MTTWRNIPSFPNYDASDEGEIRSKPRRGTRCGGILRPSVCRFGYCMVYLSVKSKKYTRRLHRLVLEAFVGPCPDGMETRHLNGVSTDNRLCNLVWGTPSENQRDKDAHGTQLRGVRSLSTKLTEAQVEAIRADHRPQRTVAAEYGVDGSVICRIRRRKSWPHIEGQWDESKLSAHQLRSVNREATRRETSMSFAEADALGLVDWSAEDA